MLLVRAHNTHRPYRNLRCSSGCVKPRFSAVKHAAANHGLAPLGSLTAQTSHLLVRFLGNGPSGICLSYLLSGYTAYLSPDAAHPNPLLHRKLGEQPHLSLLEQVNGYLLCTLSSCLFLCLVITFDDIFCQYNMSKQPILQLHVYNH